MWTIVLVVVFVFLGALGLREVIACDASGGVMAETIYGYECVEKKK